MTRETRWARLWSPFWAVPLAISVAAFVLGLVMPVLDLALAEYLPFVFQGGPEGARSMLSTIASAMISVTGVVFSITIVVLQLASSQFTPRVLGSFLDSRVTQTTLGVFTASFIYSLTVLRSVRTGFGDSEAFVPQVSVTLAFGFVVASVALFLAFIHRITSSIQVSNVISEIGDTSVALIDDIYPDQPEQELQETGPTWSPAPGADRVDIHLDGRHGSVVHVDLDTLTGRAEDLDVVVHIQVQTGSFVVEGQPLARVWGTTALPARERDTIAAAVGLGPERVMLQDVAFGIRQLVDIAERALSPGINDPTTAGEVLNELHRLLRRLVTRTSPSPYVTDTDGAVRVVYQPQSVPMLLALALDELAHYGADSPPTLRRMTAMLDDLTQVARPQYQPLLHQSRQHLQRRD